MIDWDEDRLKVFIRGNEGNETYALALAELNRRSQDKLATATADAAIATAQSTHAVARLTAFLVIATLLVAIVAWGSYAADHDMLTPGGWAITALFALMVGLIGYGVKVSMGK